MKSLKKQPILFEEDLSLIEGALRTSRESLEREMKKGADTILGQAKVVLDEHCEQLKRLEIRFKAAQEEQKT